MTMNATIKLNNGELQRAIKEYVEREGWAVSGTPSISHSTDNDRGMGSTTYSATIDVQTPPKPQK